MDTQAKTVTADKRPSQGGILDGRTRRARRRRELIEAYSSALGPATLTEGQRVDIRKAAELVALAEDCRAAAMQQGCGGPGALSALLRLESASARAVRALRLPKPDSAGPTMSRLLAEHEAEHEAEQP